MRVGDAFTHTKLGGGRRLELARSTSDREAAIAAMVGHFHLQARDGHPVGMASPTRGFTMNIDSLEKLYVHELKDLYSAENQILQALSTMIDATSVTSR